MTQPSGIFVDANSKFEFPGNKEFTTHLAVHCLAISIVNSSMLVCVSIHMLNSLHWVLLKTGACFGVAIELHSFIVKRTQLLKQTPTFLCIKMSAEDRCAECYMPVRPRQEGLQCDGCFTWQHRTCKTGISQREYKDAVRSGQDIDWRCKYCTHTSDILT